MLKKYMLSKKGTMLGINLKLGPKFLVLWYFMNFKSNDDTDNGLWAARLAAAVEQMSFGSETIILIPQPDIDLFFI